jgi:hypothetical protein
MNIRPVSAFVTRHDVSEAAAAGLAPDTMTTSMRREAERSGAMPPRVRT